MLDLETDLPELITVWAWEWLNRTLIATANPVNYTGGRPVFVDRETETWNIDPNRIEEAITHRIINTPIVFYLGYDRWIK